MRVLLVEDDPATAQGIEMMLRSESYVCDVTDMGEDGLEIGKLYDYDIIILDLMLPDMDGYEVLRRLRAARVKTPILILSGLNSLDDKIKGLGVGADDYLTKPFSVRELMARVKAILRRAQAPPEVPQQVSQTLEYEGLSIHLENRRVVLNGRPVELTTKEFDLLTIFATHPGKPYTREQLLNQVWGYSYSGYEHTVNSHINRLRAKIEADPSHPRFIRTVWGFGYRFVEREELGS